MLDPSARPDYGVFVLESLVWSTRTDIVAAARLLAYRSPTHELVGVFDCYLLTDGTVEKWFDIGEDEHHPEYERAEDVWNGVLDHYFAIALQTKVNRQTGRQP